MDFSRTQDQQMAKYVFGSKTKTKYFRSDSKYREIQIWYLCGFGKNCDFQNGEKKRNSTQK